MGGQFLDFMGGHRAHGPPVPPPTRENPGRVKILKDNFTKECLTQFWELFIMIPCALKGVKPYSQYTSSVPLLICNFNLTLKVSVNVLIWSFK